MTPNDTCRRCGKNLEEPAMTEDQPGQDPSNTEIEKLTAPLDGDDDVHILALNGQATDDEDTVHITPQDPSLG